MRQDWMSTEEWLAILLCRLHRDEAVNLEIQDIVENETVDTEQLQNLCRIQRIYPQWQDAVCNTALRRIYPEQIVQEAERELQIQDLRYLKYEREIVRIQRALDTVGVKMVVFKGISYYGTFYPSRRQRSLGDVDLIIAAADIVKAVRCLESLGYTAEEKTRGWSDAQYIVEAQRCIHTAQLTGPYGLELELHTPTFFYTGYSLQTAYDHAVQQRAGIRIPRLEDIFWIACVHSWHHYVMRRNSMCTHFHMLGYLLDVYAGYQCMQKLYNAEDILQMAAMYGIEDIVRFMIYVAYHVLDPEENPMKLQGNEERLIDWIYGDLNLSIERRLLRGEECAELMWNQRMKYLHPLNIKRYIQGQELQYRLQALFYDEEAKWPVNILETGSLEHPMQYFDFDISWTEECLVLQILPVGTMIWQEKTDAYDDYLTHLMLRVGHTYEKEPQNIIFQISDGKMRPYISEDNQPWDIHGYVVPEIQCIQNQKGVYICSIPWSVIGIGKAEAAVQLYLDLQARMTAEREKKYIDICWQAGNCGCEWQEIEDCSFLTPVILQDK